MSSISLYKFRNKVYSDPPVGGFEKIRLICFYFVLFIYFMIPWIELYDRKLLLFDLLNNKFYVFGFIFWVQDFFLFALFLIIVVILLFCVTVYAGRVWCGYLCPQTIWIRLYNLISIFIEGDRNKRIKLDNKKMNFKKFLIKMIKHFLFIFVAFITSCTFLGYFVPIENIIDIILSFKLETLTFFWILFFTFTTYLDAAWLCEQFCFLMCPYARLQTVMFDENTLVVAYDFERGEKRGHRSKNENNNLGDCVDCRRCVNVCPTGIDIRDGLQIECISCAACIDACNIVMKKLNYKPNLIRYTGAKFLSIPFKEKIRFLTYIVLIICLIFVFIYLLFFRSLINFSVIRDHTVSNIQKNGIVENNYLLKITNKTTMDNKYVIYVVSNIEFNYIGRHELALSSGEETVFYIKLSVNKNNLSNTVNDVVFRIECLTSSNKYYVDKNTKFLSLF